MLNVKHNYGIKGPCPLCSIRNDEQSHLLECLVIKLECPEVFENKDNCVYNDIFSKDIDKMNNVAKLIHNAVRTREKLLK